MNSYLDDLNSDVISVIIGFLDWYSINLLIVAYPQIQDQLFPDEYLLNEFIDAYCPGLIPAMQEWPLYLSPRDTHRALQREQPDHPIILYALETDACTRFRPYDECPTCYKYINWVRDMNNTDEPGITINYLGLKYFYKAIRSNDINIFILWDPTDPKGEGDLLGKIYNTERDACCIFDGYTIRYYPTTTTFYCEDD